jgi:light-regulated signal transduction histidine kinase (bacteriophytochrome)
MSSETKLYNSSSVQELTEKLDTLNKNLDEFVYIVSHDLKAPLRGIASLANFIEDDLGSQANPSIIQTVHMMKSRCNRMQNLIDGLLHYSRIGRIAFEKEEVDINKLLQEVIEFIIPPRNFKITIGEKMPVISAEKEKLREVFQNLISNAISYNDKEQGLVTISSKDCGNAYEFSVADNGNGIKPEHHEKIFGIFQTLQPKDKVETIGVGLTIVKKLVEQQGGKVMLESEHGQGSVFRFTWNK